jgi:hypothetical protein
MKVQVSIKSMEFVKWIYKYKQALIPAFFLENVALIVAPIYRKLARAA